MKKYFSILFLLLFAIPAKGNYVNSGHQDYVNAAGISCNPTLTGGGTVVAGQHLVMAVQANTATAVNTPTSLQATWSTPSQSQVGGTSTYIWETTATGSGAESITVNLSSGTATIGSACGVWNSTTLDTGNSAAATSVSMTTTHAVEDVIAFGQSGVGPTGISSPFTGRENISFGGTVFAVLGDLQTSSTGLQTATFTGAGGHLSLIIGLWGAPGTTPSKSHSKIIKFREVKRPNKTVIQN